MQRLASSLVCARVSPPCGCSVVIDGVRDEGLLSAGGSGAGDEGRTLREFTGVGLTVRTT